MIPRDNTTSINTINTPKILVPHNRPSHDPSVSLLSAKQKLKIMSIGMGEYALYSIVAMPISPKSYDRPSNKMKPSTYAMTIFGNFFQVSIPLELKKRNKLLGLDLQRRGRYHNSYYSSLS